MIDIADTRPRGATETLEACGTCGHKARIRFDTDRNGRLVEEGNWCEHELDRRRICRQCARRPRRSPAKNCRLCQVCYDANRIRDRVQFDARVKNDPELLTKKRRQARDSARQRRANPEYNAKRNLRRKLLHRAKMASDPKYAKAYRAKRRKEIPLEGTPEREAYLEYHRQYNRTKAGRTEDRRDVAKRQRRFKDGENPRCHDCWAEIEWDRKRRPRKRCTDCDPKNGAVRIGEPRRQRQAA